MRTYGKGRCVTVQGSRGAVLTAANPTTAEKTGWEWVIYPGSTAQVEKEKLLRASGVL